MRVLAIDIGSSSVKAGLCGDRGFDAQVRVGFKSEFDGVKVEAPAGRVLRAVARAVREVLRGRGGGGRVDVVSFCSFSSAVVVTDFKGRVRAGAITHQDRRSVAEARELCDSLGEKWLLKRTGNLPYPGGIGSSTLAWLRRHEAGVLKNARVGQLSSLVGSMLTGEWVIDPSQAVFLGLWDIQRRAWNERMCDAVGVEIGGLPRVVFADEVLGRVTKEAASVLGLMEATPVVGGFVDASAGVIQTPMLAGQLMHTSGSTDVLAMCVEDPRPVPGILTRPVGVGKVFAERWLAVRTIAASGSALEWARRVMFADLDDKAWRKILKRACGAEKEDVAEAGGVICLPAFAGERMAIEQRVGATFFGMRLSTGREEMLVAMVRGLVAESGRNYAMLTQICRPEKSVYAMGGAGALRDAIHRGWTGRHLIRELEGDSLRGLVELGKAI